jgi:hypothetical protein
MIPFQAAIRPRPTAGPFLAGCYRVRTGTVLRNGVFTKIPVSPYVSG